MIKCAFFCSEDFDDNHLLHCVECYTNKVVTGEWRVDFFSLDMGGKNEEEVRFKVIEGGREVDDDAVIIIAIPKPSDSSNNDIAILSGWVWCQ